MTSGRRGSHLARAEAARLGGSPEAGVADGAASAMPSSPLRVAVVCSSPEPEHGGAQHPQEGIALFWGPFGCIFDIVVLGTLDRTDWKPSGKGTFIPLLMVLRQETFYCLFLD
ncbi:hypothetical protein Cadr_000013054 [Camelus dromedarius]|uniref:Uncharacterized protein n=1 Tax=Camelus dromedarius TaxID=9838 RepID=A0A5N4DD84_CAMDR|nr:hypothetical protein Cadr_000013054 [Camelus dromedarius]